MRAGALAVSLAIGLCALGVVWELRPFAAPIHSWAVALVVALAGAFALTLGFATIRSRERLERFAALAAFGAALAAGSELQAAFLVGVPARVSAAPGQEFRPSASSSVAVEFPSIKDRSAHDHAWPGSVNVVSPRGAILLSEGDVRRQGPYVFRALQGPIAIVSAKSPNGRAVTVTQPEGATFASPYLIFPSLGDSQPVDLFAVPALHRVVRVAYYAGLPSHNIHIPFLLVQISEENGGSLYQGVAVSGRPIRRAGVILDFDIGEYPAVIMASAPALTPFAIAALMTLVGSAGYLWSALAKPSA